MRKGGNVGILSKNVAFPPFFLSWSRRESKYLSEPLKCSVLGLPSVPWIILWIIFQSSDDISPTTILLYHIKCEKASAPLLTPFQSL